MANTGRFYGCKLASVVVLASLVIIRGGSGADTTAAPGLTAGCRGLGQCCQGKSNTCRASGQRLNDVKSAFCFCDSACIDIGDCCTDYTELCPPVDCVLAEKWDEWSECDTRCGPGIKMRVRKITQKPLNGGKPCGSTEEKVACEGINCKIARAPEGFEELRETGKIIPATYGSWRKSKVYSPFQDIRKNLFEHYENRSDISRPSYCMKFELTEIRGSCHKKTDFWSNELQKGATLCVECQPMAMKKKLGSRCKGHGVYLKETRWNAVTVPGCHGKWTMQTRPADCQCSPEDKLSFVLI